MSRTLNERIRCYLLITIVEIEFNFNYGDPMSTKPSPQAVHTRSAASSAPAHGRKGMQARAKLKQAAMRVLEERGYHAMRITDVTREAGVATGLFYHYFSDLKSLTKEVLSDFVSQSRKLEDIERDVSRGDWYGRIYAHNKMVVESYARRPGLMRCLLQMADQDAEFSGILRASFVESLEWLVSHMPRLFPDADIDSHKALLVVYTLGASGETLMRDYFINQDRALHAQALPEDALVELLSVTFYRGLFLQNPPIERLTHFPFIEHFHSNQQDI